MNKEDLKFCPKCRTNSILMFEDQSIVECQNLNCGCIFHKEAYLEFLEYWEKLDHSLDVQWEKLRKQGKALGFDYSGGFEYLDAIGYSWDNKYTNLEVNKTYKNTPKGRSEIPKKSGAYNLRNKKGVVIHTGITTNLKRRIKEHHYDKSKKFTYITIITTKI